MVSAVANVNAFGVLPVGGLSPNQTRSLILDTKRLTTRPFGVNTFVYDIPDCTEAVRNKSAAMSKHFAKLLGTSSTFNDDMLVSYSYKMQIPIFIELNVSVISFTFGCLTANEIQLLHSHNVVCMGTATSIAEALYLKSMDVDIIVAQGYEAGGHKGSFLGESNGIGLFSLLPQMHDAVNSQEEIKNHKYIPIVAAGGIYDRRTVLAAKLLGAEGFQIGSSFLLSKESLISDRNAQRVKSATECDIVYMNSYTGRTARGIQTEFNKQMAKDEMNGVIEILPYPFQNILTSDFRKNPQFAEHTNMWCGQSGGKYGSGAMYDNMSSAEIMHQIIHSTEGLGL